MIYNVAIIGASPKPQRYANKAFHALQMHNHHVFLINPAFDEIEGVKCYPSIQSVPEAIHTVTLYVGPERLAPLVDDIIGKKPERVIMNPGTESEEIKKSLISADIDVVTACTLVMLSTNQF
jgi:predicted CoA-binding protein